MAPRKTTGGPGKTVETLIHDEVRRTNIPTAEYQPVLEQQKRAPVQVRYARGGGAALADEKTARNTDLDPQLVWRGRRRGRWRVGGLRWWCERRGRGRRPVRGRWVRGRLCFWVLGLWRR